MTDTEEKISRHNEYNRSGLSRGHVTFSQHLFYRMLRYEFGLNALYVQLHTVVPRRMFCRRNGRGRKPTSEASVSVFAYGFNLRARQAE